MAAFARYDTALMVDSKVTIRGQTTLPGSVREALKLEPGKDHIQYEILPGGKVLLSRLEDEQEDPAMNAFLQFLDTDIQRNPQNIRPFDMSRGRDLVAGMDVNIDDEISDDE